jgi:hypothetical protein
MLHRWLHRLVGTTTWVSLPELQTPFTALMPYQLATIIQCARSDTQHAAEALGKQFSAMHDKLTPAQDTFAADLKRILSHVSNTKKAALMAMGVADIRDVRRMMMDEGTSARVEG